MHYLIFLSVITIIVVVKAQLFNTRETFLNNNGNLQNDANTNIYSDFRQSNKEQNEFSNRLKSSSLQYQDKTEYFNNVRESTLIKDYNRNSKQSKLENSHENYDFKNANNYDQNIQNNRFKSTTQSKSTYQDNRYKNNDNIFSTPYSKIITTSSYHTDSNNYKVTTTKTTTNRINNYSNTKFNKNIINNSKINETKLNNINYQNSKTEFSQHINSNVRRVNQFSHQTTTERTNLIETSYNNKNFNNSIFSTTLTPNRRNTEKSYASTGRSNHASSLIKKRISQRKYEEYINKIYGDDNNDDNSYEITSRIVSDRFNGRDIAEPGQYPHMTAIGFRTTTNSIDWQCGGSLIDQNFIITAAHCVEVNGQKPYYVKIGDINLNINEDTVDPQKIRIKNIYKYPKYINSSYYYDIALIKLASPAIFTEHVYPIRLWEHQNIPYEKVFAMGYGATAFGKARTNILTHLNLTIVSNTRCNQIIPKISETKNGIIDSQICAIDTIANRDTCQGDSGGPLQLNTEGIKRIEYQLIGITSYGVGCGGSHPSVYTRVSSFLDWIEEVVWPE